METKIKKWGNSLALRIPMVFARNINIHQDTLIDLSIEDGKLVMIPIPEPEYSLTKLLAQVTDSNIHQEIDTGEAIGKEIW